MKALILGGARSGKSSHAEALVGSWCMPGKQRHYIATATAFDDEMVERIAHHQQQRGSDWLEHEVPYHLANALAQFSADDVVLIDCLTLWLNNCIYQLGEGCTHQQLEQEIAQLQEAIRHCKADVVLVSNEVGLGVVPLGQVSRLFVDNAGRMNQRIAEECEHVRLIAAGLPLVLKAPQ